MDKIINELSDGLGSEMFNRLAKPQIKKSAYQTLSSHGRPTCIQMAL